MTALKDVGYKKDETRIPVFIYLKTNADIRCITPRKRRNSKYLSNDPEERSFST